MENKIVPTSRFRKRKHIEVNSNDQIRGLKEKLKTYKFSFGRAKKARHSSLISSRRKSSNMTMNKSPNYLWIIFFVKKFVDIIKTNVWVKKLKKFSDFHFDILGDASYFIVEPVNHSARLNNPLIATMVY